MSNLVKDYQQAIYLARKGDYIEARKLLLPHQEDEKASKLIKRINMAILKERQIEEVNKAHAKPKFTLFDPKENRSTVEKVGFIVLTLLFLRFCAGLFLGW